MAKPETTSAIRTVLDRYLGLPAYVTSIAVAAINFWQSAQIESLYIFTTALAATVAAAIVALDTARATVASTVDPAMTLPRYESSVRRDRFIGCAGFTLFSWAVAIVVTSPALMGAILLRAGFPAKAQLHLEKARSKEPCDAGVALHLESALARSVEKSSQYRGALEQRRALLTAVASCEEKNQDRAMIQRLTEVLVEAAHQDFDPEARRAGFLRRARSYLDGLTIDRAGAGEQAVTASIRRYLDAKTADLDNPGTVQPAPAEPAAPGGNASERARILYWEGLAAAARQHREQATELLIRARKEAESACESHLWERIEGARAESALTAGDNPKSPQRMPFCRSSADHGAWMPAADLDEAFSRAVASGPPDLEAAVADRKRGIALFEDGIYFDALLHLWQSNRRHPNLLTEYYVIQALLQNVACPAEYQTETREILLPGKAAEAKIPEQDPLEFPKADPMVALLDEPGCKRVAVARALAMTRRLPSDKTGYQLLLRAAADRTAGLLAADRKCAGIVLPALVEARSRLVAAPDRPREPLGDLDMEIAYAYADYTAIAGTINKEGLNRALAAISVVGSEPVCARMQRTEAAAWLRTLLGLSPERVDLTQQCMNEDSGSADSAAWLQREILLHGTFRKDPAQMSDEERQARLAFPRQTPPLSCDEQ